MRKFVEKVVAKAKSEPVRLRVYALAALVLAYLMAKHVIGPDDYQFYLALVTTVLAVESSRAKVTPVTRR